VKPDGFKPDRSQQAAARQMVADRNKRVAESLRSNGAGAFDDAVELGRRKVAQEQAPVQPSAPVAVGQEPAATVNPFDEGAARADAQAGQIEGFLDDSYKNVRVGNKMYAPTQEFIANERDLGQRELENFDDAADVETRRRIAASDLADEAVQTHARMELQDALANEARQRRAAEVEDTLGKYRAATAEATERVMRMDKFDPAATFRDKPTGQKIRFFLGALGMGMRGGDPNAMFDSFVQRELTAHKQNYAQAQQGVENARRNEAQSQTVRDTFLELTQDERMADALTEKHTLDVLAAKMDRMQADFGVRAAPTEFAEARRVLEEKRNAKDLQLAQMEVANPKYFNRRVSTIGRAQRRGLEQKAKMLRENAGEFREQQAGAARDEVKAMSAQQKAAATDKYGLNDRDWKQIERYGADESVAKMEGVSRIVDQILAPEDIKGVSAIGADWFGDEPRDLNAKLTVLKNALGRAESGGAITEDELTMFTDMIEAGVEFGGGEERLRKNLREVQNMMNVRLESKRRSLSPAAQSYITRGASTDYASEHHDAGRGRKRVQNTDGSIGVNRSEFE
jgi:hypothetical protein